MDNVSLELVQWRVAESEWLAVRQMALIAEMEGRGENTSRAKAVLGIFMRTLRFMHEDLARLQAATPAVAPGRQGLR